MNELGKVLIIACDAIVWMLALGCLLCVVLTFIGMVVNIRNAIRGTDDFDKSTCRDMAIMFAFFCLGMVFITTLVTLGALALARNVL